MSNPKTIKIDNVEYVRKDSIQPRDIGTPHQHKDLDNGHAACVANFRMKRAYEPTKTNEYKPGDRVRLIGNTNENDSRPGDTGTVMDEGLALWVWIDRNIGSISTACNIPKGHAACIQAKDLRLIPNEYKPQEGDRIQVVDHPTNYPHIKVGMRGTVMESSIAPWVHMDSDIQTDMKIYDIPVGHAACLPFGTIHKIEEQHTQRRFGDAILFDLYGLHCEGRVCWDEPNKDGSYLVSYTYDGLPKYKIIHTSKLITA